MSGETHNETRYVWAVMTGENCPGSELSTLHESEGGAVYAAEVLESGMIAAHGYRGFPTKPHSLRWEMGGDWIEVRRVEVGQ